MSYEVIISNQAQADLRDIFAHIAFGLQSKINAARQIDRIEKEIMSLSEMPERYKRYDREPWLSRNTHMVTVDRFCVLYQVDRDNGMVCILRVLYGGRDIEAELGK